MILINALNTGPRRMAVRLAVLAAAAATAAYLRVREQREAHEQALWEEAIKPPPEFLEDTDDEPDDEPDDEMAEARRMAESEDFVRSFIMKADDEPDDEMTTYEDKSPYRLYQEDFTPEFIKDFFKVQEAIKAVPAEDAIDEALLNPDRIPRQRTDGE